MKFKLRILNSKSVFTVISTLLVIALFLSHFSCFAGIRRMKEKKPLVSSELLKIVRSAWINLGSSKTMCEEYDYFPDGGMRNFFCHLKYFASYKKFLGLIGVPIFRKGPHSGDQLNLESRSSFGYYNKGFVIWMRDVLIPGAGDQGFLKSTQAVYDGYVRNLARIFYVTYNKLQSNPEYMEQEKSNFLRHLRSKPNDYFDYEKYFYFMNPNFFKSRGNESSLMGNGFDGGWNGNVVKTTVTFWIRRSIDGTAEEFYIGLLKLLEAYDADFIK